MANRMKLLGCKTTAAQRQSAPLIIGFRFSLGPVEPVEIESLLAAAFHLDSDLGWEPPANLLALATIRSSDDHLAAACCVLRGGFLHQFAVDPLIQRLGLGKDLVHYVQHTFDLPYVLAQTDDTTMESGHKFWEKIGFKEVGV